MLKKRGIVWELWLLIGSACKCGVPATYSSADLWAKLLCLFENGMKEEIVPYQLWEEGFCCLSSFLFPTLPQKSKINQTSKQTKKQPTKTNIKHPKTTPTKHAKASSRRSLAMVCLFFLRLWARSRYVGSWCDPLYSALRFSPISQSGAWSRRAVSNHTAGSLWVPFSILGQYFCR